MYLRALLLASSLCLSVGCAASSGDASTSNEAQVTSAASVRFAAGSWEPTWAGTLKAGSTLAIDYDFARLPQCRNTSRVDYWVVEVSYRFDGGATKTVALSGSPGAADFLPDSGIAIPAGAKSIEMWFQNHAVGGYDDCSAFDSQYGKNYTHDIAAE